MTKNILQISVFLGFISLICCSTGDRSQVYQMCLARCVKTNCTSESDIKGGLVWTCADECKYDCMWSTVDNFLENGKNVPQFYGKWPFVRWLGLQEPASALFSLLNLLCHAAMAWQFVTHVPRHAPLFWLWVTYALVCINAWFWSFVFHAKDTDVTEKLDYFCAFSMVLFSFYSACIRVLGSQMTWLTAGVSMVCLGLLLYHVTYLSMVRFDYGYNMRANIMVGALNVLTWLCWCWWRRRRAPHVWRCALTVSLVSASVLLETADFPPLGWTLDAHALWHLSTAPLPLLWYRFLIDDCVYQLSRKKLEKSV